MREPILVIGKTGQLARALQKLLRDKDAIFWGRDDLDLAAPKEVIATTLSKLKPISGIILAAAYTAVDQAESDSETAIAVNGATPGILADYCKTQDIPLVHLSTDYVFQGNGTTAYTTEQKVDPINAYGESKLAGEIAVAKSGANAAILRTSWVFDGTGKNFLTTMLRLGVERDTLTVVADQIGRPTYAGHLADACLKTFHKLADKTLIPGVYHVTGSGQPCSWAEFAEEIFRCTSDLRPHSIDVKHILSADYPTPAARPHYSVLDLSEFEQVTGHNLPDWQLGLDAALKEYIENLTAEKAK